MKKIKQKSLPGSVAGKRGYGGLRAISIRGPEVAAAILSGRKRVENRTRPIPSTVLAGSKSRASRASSWVALHTASNRTPRAILEHVREAWGPSKRRWKQWSPLERRAAPLPKAAIVGFVRIVGDHPIAAGEKRCNPWALGPYCWELGGAAVLDPPILGVLGQSGLWKVDNERSLAPKSRARLYRALRSLSSR